MVGIFKKADSLPWTSSEMIVNCELEAFFQKDFMSSDNSDSIMRLAWILVHSRNTPDVQCGITMLEAALEGVGADMHKKAQILYLMAVGQFRVGEYTKSRRLVNNALKISPDFKQASTLKTMVKDKLYMGWYMDDSDEAYTVAISLSLLACSMLACLICRRRR